MVIRWCLSDKASLKETAKAYFKFISVSPGWEYFGKILDRELLMSPMITQEIEEKRYQYFEMFAKNFLLSYPQQLCYLLTGGDEAIAVISLCKPQPVSEV